MKREMSARFFSQPARQEEDRWRRIEEGQQTRAGGVSTCSTETAVRTEHYTLAGGHGHPF